MNFTISGLDIDEGIVTELRKIDSMYNCEFKNYADLKEFKKKVAKITTPNIIVIDIDDNENEKFKLCAELKSNPDTLILFAATEANPDDRVRWHSYGAVFNIKKPFRAEELLRQSYCLININSSFFLMDANFKIDQKKREVIYKSRKIKTTPKLFEFIVYFVENEGRVVTREDLMMNVFDTKTYLTDRNIDTFIKQLRNITSYDVIKTVRGVGYLYKE